MLAREVSVWIVLVAAMRGFSQRRRHPGKECREGHAPRMRKGRMVRARSVPRGADHSASPDSDQL